MRALTPGQLRAAAAVKAAVLAKSGSYAAFARTNDLDVGTVSKLCRGQKWAWPGTLNAIERGLGWAPNTIEDLASTPDYAEEARALRLWSFDRQQLEAFVESRTAHRRQLEEQQRLVNEQIDDAMRRLGEPTDEHST